MGQVHQLTEKHLAILLEIWYREQEEKAAREAAEQAPETSA